MDSGINLNQNESELKANIMKYESFDEISKPHNTSQNTIKDKNYFELVWFILKKAFPLFLASLANASCFTVVYFFISRSFVILLKWNLWTMITYCYRNF